MSLQDTWVDKQDEIDDVEAEYINSVARQVIKNEDAISKIQTSLLAAEKQSNKTQTIDGFANNVKYPSSKAVKNFVEQLLGSYYKKDDTYSREEVQDLLKDIDIPETGDLSNYYTIEETDGKLQNKEDKSNKISLDEWQKSNDTTPLLTDDRYLSALLAYVMHEQLLINIEKIQNDMEVNLKKILAEGEGRKDAKYYSAKATQEYVTSAIQSAVLDSWEVEV